MITRNGIETDGTYILYQDVYTKFWIIEIEGKIAHFYSRDEAVLYLNSVKHLIGTCSCCPN